MSQTNLDREKAAIALRTMARVFRDPEAVTLELRTRRGDDEVTTVLSLKLQ